MAVYNQEHSFQSILNAALGEYHSKGFRLVEPDFTPLPVYDAIRAYTSSLPEQ